MSCLALRVIEPPMHSFGVALQAVRKQKRQSIRNYLLSIDLDAQFVDEVRQALGLPCICNLRCGKWYAARFDALCYFKSTDGHVG